MAQACLEVPGKRKLLLSKLSSFVFSLFLSFSVLVFLLFFSLFLSPFLFLFFFCLLMHLALACLLLEPWSHRLLLFWSNAMLFGAGGCFSPPYRVILNGLGSLRWPDSCKSFQRFRTQPLCESRFGALVMKNVFCESIRANRPNSPCESPGYLRLE